MTALPTLIKSYTKVLNNQIAAQGTVLADYRLLHYNTKVNLVTYPVGTPGVVRSSSNASVANTSDNWSGTSSLNWHSAGNAHSWIVIRMAGIASTFDLCIDLLANAGPNLNTQSYGLYYSPGGYVTTGLVTTARPATTNSDEVTVWSNTTSGFFGNNDAASCYHHWFATDGSAFRMVVYQNNKVVGLWIVEKLQNSPTGLATPYAGISLNANALATDVVTSANLYAAQNFKLWASGPGAFSCFLGSEGYNGVNAFANQTTPNSFSGAYPFGGAPLWSTTALALGRMGTLTDLYWALTGNTNGMSAPGDTTRTWVQHGCLYFPWDGSVVLTA
jgi:hypothetical protein